MVCFRSIFRRRHIHDLVEKSMGLEIMRNILNEEDY
jgi:hypothetical protein